MDSGACGKKEIKSGGVGGGGMDKHLGRWAGRKIMDANTNTNTISIATTNYESNQQQHCHSIHPMELDPSAA